MKTRVKCLVVAFVALIASTATFAQEWSKTQKEVWQVVEDGWAKYKAGDLEGSYAYLHEKYQGWSDNDALPMTKEMVIKFAQEMKNVMKIDHYLLNPARIVITDNAAVVDYFYWYEATITAGDKKDTKETTGKNVEFYIKENGKWFLLGDMTVHEKKQDK
jgi:hypothetical protein